MGHTIDWSGSGWVDKSGGNKISIGSTTVVLTSPTLTATNGSLLLGKAPRFSANALTADTTLTEPGLYTPGGAVITVTLPKASEAAGGMFIIRSTSAHAHIITASAEATNLHQISHSGSGLNGGGQEKGSRLTMQGVAGAMVTLIGDGLGFTVLANSGTIALASP